MLYLLGAVLSVNFVGVDLRQIAPRHGITVSPTMYHHETEEPHRNMYKQLNLDSISKPLDYDIKDKWWLTLRTSVSPGTIADVNTGHDKINTTKVLANTRNAEADTTTVIIDFGESATKDEFKEPIYNDEAYVLGESIANRQRPYEDYQYGPPGGTMGITWGLHFTGGEPTVPPVDFFTIASVHHFEYTPPEGHRSPNIGLTPSTTRYTWKLFYDGPPTIRPPTTTSTTELTYPTTIPTFPTTTPMTFMDKRKKEMLIYGDGYFSTFLTSLMNIVSDKEDGHLRVLCLSISREYDKLRKKKWFASLGKPFLNILKDFSVNVQRAPLDYTRHQAMLLSEAIRERREVMKKSLSGIIDYIDTLFKENEGIALFEALELVENYPNTTGNPYQVIGTVSAALFAPYRRLNNTNERQILIDSINKEIESHSIVEEKRHVYHNGIYYMHRRLGENRTRFAIVNRNNDKVVKEDDIHSIYAAEDNLRDWTRSSKLMKRNQKRIKEVGAPSTVDSVRVHTKPVYSMEYVNPVRYKMVTRRLPSYATSKLNNRLHMSTSKLSLQHFKGRQPKMYKKYNKLKRIVQDSTKGIRTPSIVIKENAFASKDIGRTVKQYQKRFLIKSESKQLVDHKSQGPELGQDSNKDVKMQFYELNEYTTKNIARPRQPLVDNTQIKFIIKKRLKKTIESDPPVNDRESERENQGAELVKDTNKGIQISSSEINENTHTSKNIAKTRGYNQNKFIIKKRLKKTIESDPPFNDRESERENQGAELVKDTNKGIQILSSDINENTYTSKNIAKTRGYNQNKFIIKKSPKKTIESDPPGIDRESKLENQGAKLVQDSNKGTETPIYEINENAYTSKNIARTKSYTQIKFIIKKGLKKTVDSDPPGKDRESERENQEAELIQESNKYTQTPFYEIKKNAYTGKNIGRTQEQIQKSFILKKRGLKMTIQRDPPNTERDSKGELQSTKLVQLSTRDIRTSINENRYTRNNIRRTRNDIQKRFIIKKRPTDRDSNKFTVFEKYVLNPKFSTECEASVALSVEVNSIMPFESFYAVTTKPKNSFKRTPKTSKLNNEFYFTHAFTSPANSSKDNKQNNLIISKQNKQKENKPKNLNDEVDFKPYKRRDIIKQTHNNTSAKSSVNNIKGYSSYSDEEESLKTHLFDALRHDHTYFKNERRLNQDHDSIRATKKGLNELSSYSNEEAALKANIYKQIGFNDDYKKTKLSDIVKRVNDNYEENIKGVTNIPVNDFRSNLTLKT